MTNLNDPILEKGRYKHYKGNEYEVLGVGRHTEEDDYFVVYRSLAQKNGTPEFWLRPYEMFIEMVEIDGEVFPRFQKVEEA
jgi:hypothetical protein